MYIEVNYVVHSRPLDPSHPGEYTFLAVPHRSYELHFEAPGFRRKTKVLSAEKDTDIGALALFVSTRAGSGPVVTESPVQAQGTANMDCVAKMEIPRYRYRQRHTQRT